MRWKYDEEQQQNELIQLDCAWAEQRQKLQQFFLPLSAILANWTLQDYFTSYKVLNYPVPYWTEKSRNVGWYKIKDNRNCGTVT